MEKKITKWLIFLILLVFLDVSLQADNSFVGIDFDVKFETTEGIDEDVFKRVSSLINEGKYSDAELLLLSSDESAKSDPLFYNWMGLINYRKGNYDKAENNWTISSRMNPLYYLPIYNLGVLFREKNDYHKAAQYFESALEIKGDSDPVILKNLAFIYRNMREYRKALVFWQSIKKIEGETLEYFRETGYIQMQLGNTRRAMSALSKAGNLDSNDPWVYYYLSIAYQESSTQKGIEYAKKAHVLEPYNNIFLYNWLYQLYVSADKNGIVEFLSGFDISTVSDADLGGLLIDAAILIDNSSFIEKMFEFLQINNFADQTLYFNVGGYYYLKEKYGKAVEVYFKGAEIATDPTRFYLNIAQSYFVLEDYKKTIEWSSKVVARENNPQALHILAMSNFILGDTEKAKGYIDKAYSLSKEEFSLARSIIYGEISDYQKLKQQDGERAYLALFFAGDYGRFLSETSKESDDDIVFLRGVSYVNLGMGQDALTEFSKIRRQRRYNRRNLNEYLADAYRLTGNTQKALERYEAETKTNSSNTSALYKMSLVFYDLSQIDNAETTLKKVLEIEPNHSAANALMGNVMMESGKSEEGLKIWQDLFERGGRDFHLVRNYALALGEKSKSRQRALQMLTSLLSENPDSTFIYMDIGEILHESQDYIAASNNFERAAKDFSDKAYTNQAISLVYAKLFKSADSVLTLVENRESPEYIKSKFVVDFKMGRFSQTVKMFHDNYSHISQDCDYIAMTLESYNRLAEYGKTSDLSKMYSKVFPDCRPIKEERVIALKAMMLYEQALLELKNMGIKNYADSFNLAILSYQREHYSLFLDIYEKNFNKEDKQEYKSHYYTALVNSKDARRIEKLKKEQGFNRDADKIMAYASLLVRMGKEKEAAEYVEKAEKIDPSVKQRYNVSLEEREVIPENYQPNVKILYVDEYNKAMRLISENKVKQGIAILESLHEQGLEESALFSDLAAAYMSIENYEKAIEILKKGYAKYSDNYYILFNLAACYYSIEDFSKAMEVVLEAGKRGVYDDNFKILEENINQAK